MNNPNFVDMKTVEISISGMTCQSCVKNITMNMQDKDGLASIDVSLEKEKALVKYDPLKIDSKFIADSIDDMGYEAKIINEAEGNLTEENLAEETKVALLTIGKVSNKSAASLTENVQKQKGIVSCDVYIDKELATVSYKPSLISANDIELLMKELGFEVAVFSKPDVTLTSDSAVTTLVHIEGMTCDSCTNSIKSALAKMTGVEEVTVSLKEKQAVVKHVPSKIDKDEVRNIIEEAGFDASLLGEGM